MKKLSRFALFILGSAVVFVTLALVRVEAVEKGDNCTVSWRLIPAPEVDGHLAAK